MERILNFIDGIEVEPKSGAFLDNVNPATAEVYSQLPDSDERDVDVAVQAAECAFPEWSQSRASERSQFLMDVARRIESNLEGFAEAECIDTGKPISLARNLDIPRAVSNFRFFATAILHTQSEAHITDNKAINYTLRQPRGVAGCISPWNLPLYLFSWKIAPALATGNTVVAKPSEVTPMTAYMLCDVCREVGLPNGVLNVVHGLGPKVGAAIVKHPNVPAISFTGGTKTGEEIARTAGPMFKKLSLELGGKNPNIVFADASMDRAVSTSVRSAFSNQGQICLSGSRLFVEQTAYDRFVECVVEQTKKLTIGDPIDPKTEQGALVSEQHYNKVMSCIELAKKEGGTIVCGGGRPRSLPKRCEKGFFIEPTVITGLGPESKTNQEEIFGPVVSIIPFQDEDEVIQYANSTKYGLAASVWTDNINRAHRVASQIQSGTVWVNCWLLRDLRVPFGGMKSSGIGREGGDEALRFFTEPKNVCIAMNPSSAS